MPLGSKLLMLLLPAAEPSLAVQLLGGISSQPLPLVRHTSTTAEQQGRSARPSAQGKTTPRKQPQETAHQLKDVGLPLRMFRWQRGG